MDPEDPVGEVLEEAITFSFNPLVEQDERFNGLEPNASPLTFYDRHIDLKLICRNVKDFPSLGPTLSKYFEDALSKFYKDGHEISARAAFVQSKTTSVQDAQSLNVLYSMQPGKFARYLPSIFYFHPEGFVWDSVFCHDKDSASDTKKFTSECSLQVYYRHDDNIQSFAKLRPTITDATAKKLEDIRDNYPPLANWLFCAMTPAGKSVLKQMPGSRSLTWEESWTLGFRNTSSATVPPDAEDGVLQRARILQKTRTKVKVSQRRTKVRTKERSTPDDGSQEMPNFMTQKKSAYVTVLRRPKKKSVRHYLDPHQYIQHAWATATRQNSTFMVFNCGIYERIGVRHRESQTLYLSPLIETINTRNPPYGKLHLGLHIAIVQDFLERYECDKQKGGKKRSADHFEDEDIPKAKRVKHPLPALGDAQNKLLSKEMNKRELALVSLNYGPYCSPVPASFFRLGSSCARDLHRPFKPTNKSKFSQTEYFELVLGEPLGQGAVGIIHPASLSISLKSGETLRHNVVVKLAFSPEQKAKLEHEYEMYSHLALAEDPVEGIVVVHGLFKDPESGCLALFMEHGGQSLRVLNREQPERDEQSRKEERDSCIRALKSIHEADLRHRDLRSDNILIRRDPSLKVFVIDFDRSCIGSRLQQFTDEIERAEAIFDGKDIDWWNS